MADVRDPLRPSSRFSLLASVSITATLPWKTDESALRAGRDTSATRCSPAHGVRGAPLRRPPEVQRVYSVRCNPKEGAPRVSPSLDARPGAAGTGLLQSSRPRGASGDRFRVGSTLSGAGLPAVPPLRAPSTSVWPPGLACHRRRGMSASGEEWAPQCFPFSFLYGRCGLNLNNHLRIYFHC